MRYGLARLWAFYRSPKGTKLFRYVMGSVITTIVSFAVLTLVFGVFHWWGAVASTVFANVVATVPAYWLNRTWTWGKAGRSDLWREVIPFWVLSILGIAISMVTASLAADLGRDHHLHQLLELVVVDGANLAAYGVLFIGKYLVFNRLFKMAESLRSSTAPEGWAGPADHTPALATRSARSAHLLGASAGARSAGGGVPDAIGEAEVILAEAFDGLTEQAVPETASGLTAHRRREVAGSSLSTWRGHRRRAGESDLVGAVPTES